MSDNLLGLYLLKMQGRVMDGKPSLEDMWKVIEDFGISRKAIDPRNEAPHNLIEEFYLLILKRNKLRKEFVEEDMIEEKIGKSHSTDYQNNLILVSNSRGLK